MMRFKGDGDGMGDRGRLRYRGNGDGQSDGEYIFGRPQGRTNLTLYHLITYNELHTLSFPAFAFTRSF